MAAAPKWFAITFEGWIDLAATGWHAGMKGATAPNEADYFEVVSVRPVRPKKRLGYSLLLLSVAGADTTKPERKKADVLRWDGFSGPELETPVRDGEAFVVTPLQSGDWHGKPVLGWYVTPGHDAGHAWVLGVGKPFEVENPKPLTIRAFKKGAKVSAVFGTTSVLTLKDGKQPPARQYLEPGTVVEVLNGGLTYKVKKVDGGEVSTLDADDVFAR